MKNILNCFTIIICLVVLLAGTSQPNNVIATPAKPISTVIILDYYASNTKTSIERYIGKGYIVKTVTNGGKDSYIITVMEKY